MFFYVLIPPWISFLIVLGIILALSKKELGLVLSFGAFIFALLTEVELLSSIIAVITDYSIIILAIAVALIPILGGIMEESGLMVELVQKLDISKKASLMVSPAFFGLLPVPGGALMSAPIVDQIDPELNPNQVVAVNVWYRHALIMIYPLAPTLIVASFLSGISLYVIVFAMIIPFIVMVIIGYATLLRSINPKQEKHQRDIKRVLHNSIPIIIAPIIDFLGRTFFNLSVPEVFLLIGLILSIFIALRFAKMPVKQLGETAKKMKIWRFPIIIFAMFWFLEVFIRSGVPEEIGDLQLPFIVFLAIGFFLGFATGRVQLPLSIMIPIYLIQNSVFIMPIIDFVFLYSATFIGYLVTPIHPCVSYSVNFFDTDYKNAMKFLAKPALICLGLTFSAYMIFFLMVS
ncbi:MAG: DUF401 family protein [Candidatus Lokiarchaeota archaeon]|nr:DUF401 family protein [Candidatus Lokiarchaeota archaeon]MBD3338703.1 DUF401 family protein [Candidatus Lokiarchaeota archaeon]